MTGRVVAVLGYSRRGDAELHAICAARLARGQELASDADSVILSGFPEAELMRSAWTGPEVELIPEADSRSTAQNAANVARAARALGARELVVVTSSWHRARVAALMRAALRGSGIRLHVEGADAPRPLRLLAREAACLTLLPFQLPRAIR
ncbi:MAG TPA: ElyC/SanA/YdcF family protein [Gaiellaceae bacterium]|nr:ElyC/SanA/YdcF family protein [Gaiellaceae bacterium]